MFETVMATDWLFAPPPFDAVTVMSYTLFPPASAGASKSGALRKLTSPVSLSTVKSEASVPEIE